MIDIIKEDHGIAIVEIDGRYHVVSIDRERGQVQSAIPADCPPDGGRYYGSITEKGIHYVSKGRTRETAQRWFRRLVAEQAEYAQ